MKSYRLTNDFHRTEATVRPTFDKYGEATLSHRQVLRAQRELCGMSDCMCSAHGARGGEYWIDDTCAHYERVVDKTYHLHRTPRNWHDHDTIVMDVEQGLPEIG